MTTSNNTHVLHNVVHSDNINKPVLFLSEVDNISNVYQYKLKYMYLKQNILHIINGQSRPRPSIGRVCTTIAHPPDILLLLPGRTIETGLVTT